MQLVNEIHRFIDEYLHVKGVLKAIPLEQLFYGTFFERVVLQRKKERRHFTRVTTKSDEKEN